MMNEAIPYGIDLGEDQDKHQPIPLGLSAVISGFVGVLLVSIGRARAPSSLVGGLKGVMHYSLGGLHIK